MGYKIEYLKEAEKDLANLPKSHIKQILTKIDTLEFFETVPGIKKLQGAFEQDLYRLRHSDYRIIFTVEKDRVVVVIIRIANRKNVYRKIR